jgi:RimJ/RimL family protein N-acetyltransferase
MTLLDEAVKPMAETIYETERLRVRRWNEADVPRLVEFYSHPDVWEHVPDLRVRDVEEMEQRLPRLIESYERYGPGLGVWAAERMSDGLAVGTVMLKNLPDGQEQITDDVEIGWHLARDCWGQGYATEMAVMKRLGMVYRGMTQAYYGMDQVLYGIDQKRWRGQRSSDP